MSNPYRPDSLEGLAWEVSQLRAKERVMDRAYLDVIAERDALRARLARLERERNAEEA